jgi:hypothetical protein
MLARRALLHLGQSFPKSGSSVFLTEMSKKFATKPEGGKLSGKVAIVTASTQGSDDLQTSSFNF